MSATTDYLNQISNSIEELQKAQISVVEAKRILLTHDTNPNAHANLFSGEEERLLLAKLSEQMLALIQRVQYLEENDIEQDNQIKLLQGNH